VNSPVNDFQAQAFETRLPRIDPGTCDGVELPMMRMARQNCARQLTLDKSGSLMRATPVICVDLPAELHEQNRNIVDPKRSHLTVPDVLDAAHLDKRRLVR
jgi:hypothetical protein